MTPEETIRSPQREPAEQLPERTCRGCAGEFDRRECRHPHQDKRSCWRNATAHVRDRSEAEGT